MRRLATLTLLCCLLLTGCESSPSAEQAVLVPENKPAAPSQLAGKGLFQQPFEPKMVELATGALPLWQGFSRQKPALVVMSIQPFLSPLAAELKQRAVALIQQGDISDIERHGSFFRSDPVILPDQAVSAAIDAELFSKIYWVFPSQDTPDSLSLDKFREQMRKAQILTEDEAAGLSLKGATFTGTVRGVPFAAVHYLDLASIQDPLVLHIDLSFFRGLYDNEIKTPLYGLIRQTADALRDSGWSPLQLSCSYSTLEGEIALESRFVLNNLAAIFRDPRLLDGEIPAAWKLRAQALYAADMFSEAKKFELYRQAAEIAKNDPGARYDLFQARLQNKELEAALEALDRAIELDPGYAAVYLAIANMAGNDGNQAATLRFLEKAATHYPLNPFVDIGRAELLLKQGNRDAAIKLITDLQKLHWSPVYHPDIPEILAELQRKTQTDSEVMDGK